MPRSLRFTSNWHPSSRRPRGRAVVGITSCRRGEGTSTVALGLALAAAQASRKKVLLVDANFLAPAVHEALAVDPAPGLIEIIGGSQALDLALQPTGFDSLWALPAGLDPPDATAGKPSMDIVGLFAALAMDFSFIVVDLPPIDRLDAALGAATAIDGVVLVIEAECTGRNLARSAAQVLADGRLLGAVLNKFQDPNSESSRVMSPC